MVLAGATPALRRADRQGRAAPGPGHRRLGGPARRGRRSCPTSGRTTATATSPPSGARTTPPWCRCRCSSPGAGGWSACSTSTPSEPRDYGPYDLALLTQVANLMARAIENARLYQRLAEREEMLESFATRTIEAQEHERRRLAGEIHDGISQRLISLWYHLLAAEDGADGGRPGRRRAGAGGGQGAGHGGPGGGPGRHRRPAPHHPRRPRPGASLESLARSLAGEGGRRSSVEPVTLPPHVEVALYRIAQEAFQNVVKHADAHPGRAVASAATTTACTWWWPTTAAASPRSRRATRSTATPTAWSASRNGPSSSAPSSP